MRQAEFNCITQHYINSTITNSFKDSNLDFNVILTDETHNDTYLTLDMYLIDTSTDNLIEEFPALSVDTLVTTLHGLLCQQSKAQNSATLKHGQTHFCLQAPMYTLKRVPISIFIHKYVQ